MKRREITVTGNTSKSGALKMYMAEIIEFFKKHPDRRVIAKFTVLEKDPSEAMKGYYFNYVVPEMKQVIWESGDRKTEDQTEEFLRKLSPVTVRQKINESTGRYESSLRSIGELSSPELVEHIEFIKQIAAEEYGAFIDEPKIL